MKRVSWLAKKRFTLHAQVSQPIGKCLDSVFHALSVGVGWELASRLGYLVRHLGHDRVRNWRTLPLSAGGISGTIAARAISSSPLVIHFA